MKKQILSMLLFCSIALGAFAEKTKVEVKIKDWRLAGCSMTVDGSIKYFDFNENLEGSLEFDLKEANYAYFDFYGSGVLMDFYLTPGKDLSITIHGSEEGFGVQNKMQWPVSIECEDGGINQYLLDYHTSVCKTHEAPFTNEEMAAGDEVLVKRLDELVEEYRKELKKTKLPKEFKKVHYEAIPYLVVKPLAYLKEYVKDAAPGDLYYNKLKSLLVEKEILFHSKDYNAFVNATTKSLGEWKSTSIVECTTKSIKLSASFKDKNIKNKLIASYAFPYFKKYGTDGTEEIQAIMRENLEAEDIEKLDKIVKDYAQISRGQASFKFEFKDIDGKLVSSDDFIGKYLLIDLWATWCGPCKKEIPFLEKLEHEYEGKDIQFVSISLDKPKNKEKWSKMVKEKNMGGIQLFANGDLKIAEFYKAFSIPRFVFIDKEGKIISMNTPKPSSVYIRPLLDKYLK
ncbi:TlpA family protein disulfide reductase [Marinifilum sp.]|uniref:TlpA family protein disulfide reductase n=1 Tax=Marinifilum sp. TaxID=2033137 RepID=UPI003BAC47F1